MKTLLNKSINSIEASQLLKDEEHYASSVHCSYYSCIQLMRHILFNYHNEDEATFDNDPELKKMGSHEFFKNRIISILKNSSINTRDFNNDFRIIKSLRKNADYKQVIIFLSDSNNAYRIALKINNLLKEKYHL